MMLSIRSQSCTQEPFQPVRTALAAALFVIPTAVSGPVLAEDPCSVAASLDPAEEVAATPREDEVAEILALHWSSGAAADSQLYEQIHGELEQIRAFDSTVTIEATRRYTTNNLLIAAATEEIRDAMILGSYTEWDCLTERFKLTSTNFWTLLGLSGSLTFDGHYKTGILAELFAALSGITYTERDSFAFIPDTGCRSETAEGVRYFFDTLDCDMVPIGGCFPEETVSVLLGDPLQVERWQGGPEPSWMTEYSDCLQRTSGAPTIFRDGFESGNVSAWQ